MFTHVTACMLAKSPEATRDIRGFSRFVTATTAPTATGWSNPLPVACSPRPDPCVMRVSTARMGKEILAEEEATQSGADQSQVA